MSFSGVGLLCNQGREGEGRSARKLIEMIKSGSLDRCRRLSSSKTSCRLPPPPPSATHTYFSCSLTVPLPPAFQAAHAKPESRMIGQMMVCCRTIASEWSFVTAAQAGRRWNESRFPWSATDVSNVERAKIHSHSIERVARLRRTLLSSGKLTQI